MSAVPRTSDQAQRVDSGDEDGILYASVQFKAKSKDKAPDSPTMQPQVQEKEEDVDYASVQFRSPSCAVNQWVTESVQYVLQAQHGVTTCLWPKYTR